MRIDFILISTISFCILALNVLREPKLPSITIRKLDADVKNRLRKRAANNGRSMEAEARLILRDALVKKPSGDSENLAEIIRAHMAPLGGVELELPPRHGPEREPPTFD